jgi:tetratricopeptide (TPR) repeat protein
VNGGQASADAAGAAQAAVQAKHARNIAFLVARADSDPLDVFSLNSVAMEYMQRARETGDVSDLSRADDALHRSLRVRLADNYDAIALLAAVTTTKHDFAGGLTLAQQAVAMKPNGAYGYGVLGDALMGLGRYDDAGTAYDRMLGLSPDISAYGRRALLLQTRGDLSGAEDAWREAIALAEAPDDGVPEHAAWAHTQLASLQFSEGRLDDAQANYATALAAFPGYVHALAGAARVAAADGDYVAAIDGYTKAINTVPLPEYVIALGDVYAASGDATRAQDQYDLIGAIEQLYAANGVNLDLQIGLFNADHGRNIGATVTRARAAYAEQPSLQAADTLAWVEYTAGHIAEARAAIAAALATGTQDPLVHFHAGMIAKAAGDADGAREHLALVERQAPRFSVRYAAEAKAALDEVSSQARGE